jgi:cobalt-zinc-cadmium efflux system protein
VIIAGVALLIDVVTAMLTYAMSKNSMNIRAAFLHNVADALGSVGVVIAGTLILIYEWTWIDPAITLLIAAYILWQAFAEIGSSVRVLMMAVPEDIDISSVVEELRLIEGVEGVHHVHVWAIDEGHNAIEVHLFIGGTSFADMARIKTQARKLPKNNYRIGHSTIEIESYEDRYDEGSKVVGHEARELSED